jgi:antitoxin component YwqK of YwqJK toxin-antitoxin module
MEGEWKVLAGDVVVGKGTMKQGRGTWTSFYATGEKLAEGRYAASSPEGRWKMFHRSGNLAAEGVFDGGTRVGKWRFYHDTPARTMIAVGRFGADGSVIGRWQHFDVEGKLLARSWTETPAQWQDDSIGTNGGEGSVLEVMPGRDGVRHVVHQGTPGQDVEYNEYKLELFSKGKEKLYIANILGAEAWYGADGVNLVHDANGWSGRDCRWSTTRKLIAQQGDVPRLDGVLSNDAVKRARAAKEDELDQMKDTGVACKGATVEISAARAKRLDALLASRDTVRSATPQMVRQLILDEEQPADPDEDSAEEDLDPEELARNKREQLRKSDLARILAGNMAMYIEWPHIDRRFTQVYATMAGRYVAHWASRSDEDGDPSVTERE